MNQHNQTGDAPSSSNFIAVDDPHQATLIAIALQRLARSSEFRNQPAKVATIKTLTRRASAAAQDTSFAAHPR